MNQTTPAPKRTFEREFEREFKRGFKLQVVRQLQSGEKRLAQICREYNLCQTLVRRWRDQYEQKGENAWLEQTSSNSNSVNSVNIVAVCGS